MFDILGNIVAKSMKDEVTDRITDLSKVQKDYMATADGIDPINKDAMSAIDSFADDGQKKVLELTKQEQQKLAQSYSNEIYEIFDGKLSTTNTTTTDLKDVMNFKMYAVRNDFTELCVQAIETIQTEIESSEENIKRVLQVFENDRITTRNIPREFVPIVFPDILGTIRDEFKSLKDDHHEAGFNIFIKEYTGGISKSLYDQVAAQITLAVATIESTTNKLNREQRGIFSRRVNNIKRLMSHELDDILIRIDRDFVESMPKYVKGVTTPEALADFAQSQYDSFAKRLNVIGDSTIKSLLDIQESLAEQK